MRLPRVTPTASHRLTRVTSLISTGEKPRAKFKFKFTPSAAQSLRVRSLRAYTAAEVDLLGR